MMMCMQAQKNFVKKSNAKQTMMINAGGGRDDDDNDDQVELIRICSAMRYSVSRFFHHRIVVVE